MVILGTELLSVNHIDLESIVASRADGIGGSIAPRSQGPNFGDAIADPSGACRCGESTADGVEDLTIRFVSEELALALEFEDADVGSTFTLMVSGMLSDGSRFEATDCVVVGNITTSERESTAPWTGDLSNRLVCIPPEVLNTETTTCELRASLVVNAIALSSGSQGNVAVLGSIEGDATFGVTIMVEVRTREGNVGTVSFTPASPPDSPTDIVQIGDPWPGAGLFTPFDTDLAGSSQLNGSVDDDGNHVPVPLTYTGILSSFPVQASPDAEGVWDVVLETTLGDSEWEAVPTTLRAGSITVSPP